MNFENTVYVEFHDSFANEDVIEQFRFPAMTEESEITSQLDQILHPFQYRILA
jgi:hypothetical protein